MARIRTIKPEFPQSETIGRLSREARLLFIQLWTVVDDSGRARGNSRILASLLYPFDTDAFTLMDGWISELEREKCVARYQVEGNTYIEILNWLKHQKIDKPSPSRIPPFDESSRILANPREVSATDLVPRTVDHGPITEDQKDSRPPATQPDLTPTEEELTEESNKKAAEEDRRLHDLAVKEGIDRLFDYYCRKIKRDPKRYTLTPARREKAKLRLEEREKISGMEGAIAEAKQCVDNLAASDHHRTGGYLDWTEQIFRSAEEFEKRLNWQKPEVNGGSNGTHQGNQSRGNIRYEQQLEELAKAGVTIASRRPEAGAEQDVPVAGRGDGLGSSGVVLEGIR